MKAEKFIIRSRDFPQFYCEIFITEKGDLAVLKNRGMEILGVIAEMVKDFDSIPLKGE